MASLIYASFLDDVYKGDITCDVDTFKMMLLTSSYTPTITHTKRSDLTANEVTGTGYTAGGKSTAVTISKDTVNKRNDLDFADNNWTTSTITARYAGIYKSRGGADTADELVAVIDFGSNVSTTGGTFTADVTGPLRVQLP